MLVIYCRITCDLEQLFKRKCEYPPMETVWQVDPLKFKVESPLHEGITYIAVITKQSEEFVLREVYIYIGKKMSSHVHMHREYD